MKRKQSGKSFVVVGIGLVVAVLGGALFAFFGIGRARFERGSFMTEAHVNVAVLARGIAACAESPEGRTDLAQPLPATTPPVPATIAALRGQYRSAAKDWQSPAFRCAKFAITSPQHFQYRWELTASNRGIAEAAGDFDDDGTPDVFLHATVTCAGGAPQPKCEIGPVLATSWMSDAAPPM